MNKDCLKSKASPPKWATTLLTWLADPNTLEEVQGDLLEMYAYWSENDGEQRARWRYILSVFKLLRPFAKEKKSNDYSRTYFFSHAMIRNYFKIYCRNLLKDRLFSSLNLFGLSSGLVCAFLISLWVNDELSVDKFHEKDRQLYRVLYNLNLQNEILTLEMTPSPLAKALVEEMPEVERAVSVNYFMDWFAGKGVVSTDKTHTKAQGIFATKDFFNVFSYKLSDGKSDLVLTDKYGVVISKKLAKKLFHTTQNLIGKSLDWNHRMKFSSPLIISGVFDDLPANSTDQFDIIFNYDLLLEREPAAANWRGTYANTYLILKGGTDVTLFNKKIQNLSGSKDPANANCTLFVEPFSDKYLYGNFKNGSQAGGKIEYVRLFSFIALFILVIACINFVNLTTAQASKKMKEIGVKKALGASRKSLIYLFLGESLFMTLLSAIASIGLIILLLPVFNEIADKNLSFSLRTSEIIIIGAIILFTALLSGFYPAFYLSGFNPIAVLKGRISSSITEIWIRKGLVVFQFSMSVIFIIGFFVINKQIDFIQRKNLGYNRSNIISFIREGNFGEKSEAFLAELRGISGVENAATMPGSILDGTDNQSGFSWRGQKSDEGYVFKSPRISLGVIETLDIKMLAGRSFSKEFNDDATRIILNESAAKKMELRDPVGKFIKTGDGQSQIIGVVQDFQYGSIHQAIEPLIIRYRGAETGPHVMVKIKAGSEKASISQIQKLYEKFHPKYSFEYTFLDQDYQRLYVSEQRVATLSNLFAGLAIFISCLGLFGLTAFTAQKRQKEIGIRKVLGATIAGIAALLSRDFLKLICIAIVIATPVAYYLVNNWLQNFAYHIEIEWWIFVIAGAALVVVALCTISYEAIKAALLNPVKSLRSE